MKKQRLPWQAMTITPEPPMSDKPASETPRTDKAKFKILSSLQSGTDEVVHAWVAEELESALHAAEERAQRLAKERDGWESDYDRVSELLQQAEQSLAQERAACARVCDAVFVDSPHNGLAAVCAKEIRALDLTTLKERADG